MEWTVIPFTVSSSQWGISLLQNKTANRIKILRNAKEFSCVAYCREPALGGGWTRGSPELPSNSHNSVNFQRVRIHKIFTNIRKKKKNHKGSRSALLWQPWSSAPQPSSQRDGQTLLSHGFGHPRKFQYKDSAKRSNMTTHYINHCLPRILSPAAFLYMNTHSIIC